MAIRILLTAVVAMTKTDNTDKIKRATNKKAKTTKPETKTNTTKTETKTRTVLKIVVAPVMSQMN